MDDISLRSMTYVITRINGQTVDFAVSRIFDEILMDNHKFTSIFLCIKHFPRRFSFEHKRDSFLSIHSSQTAAK